MGTERLHSITKADGSEKSHVHSPRTFLLWPLECRSKWGRDETPSFRIPLPSKPATECGGIKSQVQPIHQVFSREGE